MNETTGSDSRPLTVRIQELVASGELSLPPLPAVATRLMQLLENDDQADSKKVAALVHSDPAVAASLLRVANSAAYGGLRRIEDLSQAVARIGLTQVSSIVTALLVKGHFESDKPDKSELLQALWSHAMATAIVAKHLTSMTGGDGEQSFLAGLLHDVGKLLVLKGVDLIQKRDPGATVTEAVVDELMETMHADLGSATLESWHLPPEICSAARDHHMDDSEDPLVLRVQAADAISRKLGAHPRPEPDRQLSEVVAIRALELSDLELATLMIDLEDELGEARDFSAASPL